jgi:DNA-binding transcriptional regulator YhcF (GntR family)
MKITLAPDSPVPLYHQIAETLSYQIATGRIPPGHRLPSVREAAQAWNVNLHTVRRAYGELAERGLVDIRGPRGTRVLGRATSPARARKVDNLDAFLQRILHEGRAQYGLARHDLVRLLANWSPADASASELVHVVECSEEQCDDHVREIEERWEVEARPWCLSRSGEPPPGPIVSTYFHYNEVRRRWPHRLHEIRFAAIHADPQLAADRRLAPCSGKRVTLTVCEFDEPMARNIAADVSVLFPADRYRIKTRLVTRGSEILGPRGQHKPLLLSPRVWGSLEPEGRTDPRAIKIVYVLTEEELENLGASFGWHRRRRLRHHG